MLWVFLPSRVFDGPEGIMYVLNYSSIPKVCDFSRHGHFFKYISANYVLGKSVRQVHGRGSKINDAKSIKGRANKML